MYIYEILKEIMSSSYHHPYIFFSFSQIIDELLDIEKQPRKPQYTMASGQFISLEMR